MDVFVIPVGADRYELYCEQPDADTGPVTPPSGMVGRAKQRVADLLRTAEERRRAGPREPAGGFFARLNDRVMAWVAERVAEQRLLWNVRRETTAEAVHPDDLSFEQVRTLIQRMLQRDLERHQRWVWIDGALFLFTFVVLGPLFLLIPGIANLPALFFGFRTVGHWYSSGGARHALRSVEWTGRPCPALTELRAVPHLPPEAREAQLRDISARLPLQHFASFYDRVSKASL